MKFLLLKMSMIMSSSILMLKTPMSMGILLLVQTTMSTLIISKIMPNSWLSMIMFLMFVGGLLILFMYMSSIASNEKFKPNLKIMIIIMLLIFPMEELLSEMQNLENTNNLNLTYMEMTNMTKIYNKKTFLITIMMFMYMFLTMVVVTSIIKIFKGPLRAK
uniref:NADH-ubiquinone oxidoreductase chain 6 n=1 Tax=Maiestas dorsalis TaxID=1928073 RepID=A0A343ASS4_9HEMI|nr:NADH dehydrogenase subunit 6 [Maiestas dorsalis]APO09335.1 NADH dehydrogenase subunit 6 [Maiestas dorsalis]